MRYTMRLAVLIVAALCLMIPSALAQEAAGPGVCAQAMLPAIPFMPYAGDEGALSDGQQLFAEGKYAEAAPYLEVETDDALSVYCLSEMYLSGLGVQQDEAYAKELLMQAIRGENTLAMLRLGTLYEYGVYVEENLNEAAVWYVEALYFGNEDASAYIEAVEQKMIAMGIDHR